MSTTCVFFSPLLISDVNESKKKTRSQCSVIALRVRSKKKKYSHLSFSGFFILLLWFFAGFFKEASYLLALLFMFSLWKYQVQKERESTVSNDGSQSVKRRRRTLSTRCLVQFTHAGGDGGGDLPHHPYFFSRAAAKKLFLLDYQVRVVVIELHYVHYYITVSSQ